MTVLNNSFGNSYSQGSWGISLLRGEGNGFWRMTHLPPVPFWKSLHSFLQFQSNDTIKGVIEHTYCCCLLHFMGRCQMVIKHPAVDRPSLWAWSSGWTAGGWTSTAPMLVLLWSRGAAASSKPGNTTRVPETWGISWCILPAGSQDAEMFIGTANTTDQTTIWVSFNSVLL